MSAFLAAVIVKSECNLMLVWEGDWDLERWVRALPAARQNMTPAVTAVQTIPATLCPA